MNYSEIFLSSLVGAVAVSLIGGVVALLKIVLSIREQLARLTQKLDDHIASSTDFMKKKAALLLLFFGCLFAAGCANFPRSPFVATTNVVERVIPATPTQPALTNYATNIVFEVAPAFTSTVSQLRAVNSALPTPASPFIDLGLLGLTALLGWFARLKTVQAQRRLSMLRGVISGVEVGNHAETKTAIERTSIAAGYRAELDALVQELTR